jgi:hypothetical protein
MNKLPNAEHAFVDIRKLTDYLLDPTHHRGRHKARVFRAAFGIGQGDAEWLRDQFWRQLGRKRLVLLIRMNSAPDMN